ncbi:MAG TPA: hypothetical protein VG847_08055 [Chitinophagaceae bacterium]|nr:hypothetical protein [Chitinophagaceae bacterium]
MLNLLTDKKKEIQRFIRSNKIKIRKDEENAFTKIVSFYNSTDAKK